MQVTVVAEQLRRTVPGGVGTYAHGLLLGLSRLDPVGRPEVTVHASRPRHRPDPLASYGFPIRLSPVPSRGLTRLWGLGALGVRGQVVHAVSLATARTSGPLAVMVHDLAWREVPETFPARGRRWHEAALGRAVRRAAVLLAPSEQTAAALAGAGGRRVEVVEEGCDHLPAPDLVAAWKLLARRGVTGPFLLSVGTIEPRKNLARLAQAYGRARSRLPEPWPLVVVGPPGWGEPGTGGTPSPGPGVVATGPVAPEVLAGLYAAARCLAYVPLREGFGLPPVEAMAHGLPVVASPMPSTAGAALEVDPTDVGAMADALVAAACDDSVRADLASRGRQRAAGLTWAEAAGRHVRIWESVL